MKILSGTSNLKLSKDIAKNLKLKLINTHIRRFADGEIYIEINENNERYFQRTNSDSTTEIVYSEDQLEIGQSTQTNGNSTTYVKKTETLKCLV